jgi:hypothetical protein
LDVTIADLERRSKETLLKQLAYCQKNSWTGYDPYDALNSGIVKALPFLRFRGPRIIFTQVLKHSPVNVRRPMLIPKTQNPKTLALFLSALRKLSKDDVPDRDELISLMIERLIALRSQHGTYWCWGYSFPWQGRNVFVPKDAPNLVCTYFVASSLLDAYEERMDPQYLTMAVSAAEYILNELYWSNGPVASFSYPSPAVKNQVYSYSANLLAAALLCRVQRHTGEQKFVGPALSSACYVTKHQDADGS